MDRRRARRRSRARPRWSTGADAVIHVAGVINAPTRRGSRRAMSPAPRPCSPRPKRAGVEALRPRQFARRARARPVALRREQGAVGGAGRRRRRCRPRSSARPRSTAPATARRSNCSRWRQRGLVLLPPAGQLSLIHVDDLAGLLLALAASDADNCWSSPTMAAPAAGPTASSARRWAGRSGAGSAPSPRPRALLRLAARADTLVRGRKAKLTPDRAAYFCHPDWTVSPARAAPAALWQPQIDTEQGLAATARWYRGARLAVDRAPSLRPIRLLKRTAKIRTRP